MILHQYIDRKFLESLLIIPKINKIENLYAYVNYCLKMKPLSQRSGKYESEADKIKHISKLYLLTLFVELKLKLNESPAIAGFLNSGDKDELIKSLLSDNVRWSHVLLKQVYDSVKHNWEEAGRLLFFNSLYQTILRPIHRNLMSVAMKERRVPIEETIKIIEFLGFTFYPLDIFDNKHTTFDPLSFEEYSKKISNDVPNRTIIDVHAMGIKYHDGRIIAKPEVVIAINA